MSQLDLAHRAGVSARHLSFVETGRSKPSAELVVALAAELDVPLRDRNTMLLAAGFAPRYSETPIHDPSMDVIRKALQRLLDVHNPCPGIVLDLHHNIVMSNATANKLIDTLPETLRTPPVNMFRASLHPTGFGRNSPNFQRWAHVLLAQLDRLTATTHDPELVALQEEVRAYPNLNTPAAITRDARDDRTDSERVVTTIEFLLNGYHLSLFSTFTSFGSPIDITLTDISIELFFPADDTTANHLGELADTAWASTRHFSGSSK